MTESILLTSKITQNYKNFTVEPDEVSSSAIHFSQKQRSDPETSADEEILFHSADSQNRSQSSSSMTGSSKNLIFGDQGFEGMKTRNSNVFNQSINSFNQFNNSSQTEINRGVQEGLRGILQELAQLRSERGQEGSQKKKGDKGEQGSSEYGGGTSKWRASDIGFFDSYYEGKSSATASSVEQAGRDTIYRDVYVFTDRMREQVYILGAKMIRNNISMCFRGQALI